MYPLRDRGFGAYSEATLPQESESLKHGLSGERYGQRHPVVLKRSRAAIPLEQIMEYSMQYRTMPTAYMAFLVAILLLASCASQTGSSYTSGQTRQASEVYMGTITHLDAAYIDNNPTGVGTLGGAVVGGVVGSAAGSPRWNYTGRTLMTLGGAVIGALAGTGVEKALNSKDALDITVNLDNGQTLSIVQELGNEERSFAVGDRVRVLRGSGDSARVRR